MEKTLERSTLSLRLRNDIKEKAKKFAQKEHRSLSNYIEFLILKEEKRQKYSEVYREPNEETFAAMEEARKLTDTDTEIDLSSNENFLKSMGL